ncbi:hypothetical protein VE03_08466 [Pseudogymnoascus sp. 23342-1-I1]|nr:hypothetical protein VE03_08466 [Pseudogymnoascus sp. 23342-1-I1]
MPVNFLTLPRELRDKIYELCLLHEEPISPWVDCRYQPTRPWDYLHHHLRLSPRLLGVNKIINLEASLILYQNSFDLDMGTPERIALFFETIGHNNAGNIRRIYVNFPTLCYLEPGNVAFDEGDSCILASIQRNCVNLKTITTTLESTNDMEVKLDACDNLKIVDEALTLVDTSFRAISSLQDIHLQAYMDAPSDYIRSRMKQHGWTVFVVERVEEWEESSDYGWDGYDDYEWDLYEDGSDHDNYDVEYDSDFWRRAAD